MSLHLLYARLMCSLHVISCSFAYLLLALSLLPLVFNPWLVHQLCFCPIPSSYYSLLTFWLVHQLCFLLIPSSYYTLLSFGLFIGYASAWSHSATTCNWTFGLFIEYASASSATWPWLSLFLLGNSRGPTPGISMQQNSPPPSRALVKTG